MKETMKLDLKRGLCFSAALLVLLFGSGTVSNAASQCNGSIVQCYNQEEFFMESQISKGILSSMQQKRLDYSVLYPDRPASPNPMPGRSYTNPRCNDPYLRAC
ncbi:hypothetical protein AAC387_Pa02g1373 [Persea americana]